MSHRTDTSRVTYVTALAAAVPDLVHDRYGLPPRTTCTLLNRGCRDCYAVVIPAGERVVLRLSCHRARRLDDVEAGTTFLARLASAGVPVPAAVPTWTGALFTAADLPDSWRPAVLFHHAEGRPSNLDGRDDARLQRMTLVRIIKAAHACTARTSICFRLDRHHPLHCQAAAVLVLVITPLDSFSETCAP